MINRKLSYNAGESKSRGRAAFAAAMPAACRAASVAPMRRGVDRQPRRSSLPCHARRRAPRAPVGALDTGSTAPASTAWSNVLRPLYWAPASMPQHRAREHAAHPDAASARLQSDSLTAARSTSTCSCAAQRSSSGASPHCPALRSAACEQRSARPTPGTPGRS